MLIMVPHGELQAETEKVFLGRGDSPLTERGREQVEDCLDTVRQYSLDFVLVSDDQGSSETAGILLQDRLGVIPMAETPELRGRSGGIYEGIPYAQLRKQLPPRSYRAWERELFVAPEHGESYADMAERIALFIRNEVIPRINRNQVVLIVAGPEVIRIVGTMITGGRKEDIISTRVERGVPHFYYGTG